MTIRQIIMWIKDWRANKPTTTIDRGVERPRSGEWPRVRREHLQREGLCQWCGGTENLEVHHIMAFHLDPTKELDDSNLITLCENPAENCHLHHGHPLKDIKGNVIGYNFRTGINPNVKQDCINHKQSR